MPSTRTPRILEEWRNVASAASLPPRAPKPVPRTYGIGLGAAALASAVLILAAVRLYGGLFDRPIGGGGESPSPTAPVASSSPSLAEDPASAATTQAPVPGGICSAAQLVLGKATNDGFFTTLGRVKDGVTQPFNNTGSACTLVLPRTISVASSGGSFQLVDVSFANGAKSFQIATGASRSIVLTAIWSVGGGPPGQSQEPCAHTVAGVTRAEIQLASGSLAIDLGTTWREVCTAPPSVTVTLED